MNIDSASIKVFQNYMLFFEHAKRLKATNVVSRGLVSPEFGDNQNILKRISSILLKGLRSPACLDINSELCNNFQKVKLSSITRQRRMQSGSDTRDYFTFLNKYEFSRFIVSGEYDENNVKVISSSEHKRRFAETLFGITDDENVAELLRTHEFVFAPVPQLWNIGNNYARFSTEAISEVNESLGVQYPGQNYMIEARSVNCVLDNTINGLGWHTYREYGEATINALYKKYYCGENVRVPSIGTPDNFRPIISDTSVRRMLDANSNHLLCNLSSHFRDIRYSVGLYLCKRCQDGNGDFLAPNLIGGFLEYYWRCSSGLLSDPEAFYTVAKKVNDKLKNKLVGITNE